MIISTLPPLDTDPEDIPSCDLPRSCPHLQLTKLLTAKDSEPPFSPVRSPNILLTLCLIHETKKSGGSFYQPYLNVLPQKVSQPLLWDQSSLMQLQNSPIFSAVHSAKKQLENDYAILAETLFTVRSIFMLLYVFF